ncbi:MAG: alkaline phosphatase [Clostridia bacterium]|nr:alkaline phosphatase [Clostridia bacterium]
MKKRIVSLMLVLMMLASTVFVTTYATEGQIKNIIYLIPDGGGYGPYDFANMVKIAGGFDVTKFPTKTPTTTDPMTMRSYLAGSMTTACITGAVTDSAAAGTAMATGVKTVNGYVGIDRDMIPVANLVEAAESADKATGIISTYHWAHATPAAFTAHAEDRNDLLNIYQQIENKGLEVVLGVGYGNVSQYATIQNAIDAGYTVVETKEDLLNVKPGDKIWGNVDSKGIPYDVYTEEGEPTLAEMTAGAITALSGDSDGFFLMVEGGKVDTGGHANSANTTTSEYLAFDAAFRVAVDFAKGRTDTVVICAPDHDTGGMIIPEDPEVAAAAVAAVMAGENPTSITWESYSHTAQNVGVWVYAPEGVALIDGLNETLGDTAETRENYVIDNTDIAPWCADLMGVDLEALSEELFCDVSTIGQYNVLERKFTFNNGDGSKYIYANQDEYYKDGETISLNGKTSMYLNNRFYVPAEAVEEEDWNYVTEAPPRDGITGTGTASDPYILDDAYDFMEFTANMIAGTTYSGKYIRQTKDIDLTTYSEYKGIGKSFNFAGTYDGYGKRLTVAITADSDVSVFPVVTGTLMNVGTEGSVTSSGSGAFAAGVAYYVGPGGKIVNCYSNAKVKAAYTGGITTYNEGLVGNCSFCGTLESSKKRAVPVGMPKEGSSAEFWECYYLDGVGNYSLDTATAAGETFAKTQLAETLNANRKDAATKLGFSSSSLISYWNNDYGYPIHGAPNPVVESVTITPSEAVVKKGEGIQLSAEVTGKYNPSQEVTWSIEGDVSEDTTITSDGYLTVSSEEKATSFTVMAKSNQDGGKVDVITITISADEGEEPGGGEEPGESEKPDGSLEKPYLIETAADFKQFTDSLISGSTFSGKYFLQTEDIDMSEVSGYLGAGSTAEFAGIYNGNGKKIKVNITSDADVSVFPNLSGVIINLSTEGTVTSNKSEGYAAGLVYYIGSAGKIANCYSTAHVRATYAGGITTYSRGLVGNCAFFGSLRGGKSSVPVGITTSNATCEFWQCYYLEGTGTFALDVATAVTETTAKTTLAATLNANRNTVATKLGCNAELVSYWNNDYGYPQHGEPEPVAENITISFTPATGGSIYYDSNPVGGSESFVQGEEITLKAVPEEGSEFKAWINASTGKIITTDEECTFTAYTNRKLLALFADEASDDVFVSFISKNNQYIYYSYLAKGTDVSTVAPSPEKMYVSGYSWNGFIPQPAVVNANTDYKGSYTKNPDTYEIKISGGADKKGNTEIALGYNSSCTVIANAPDSGKVFTGWLINGRLASLNPEFTFYVFGDMTLDATFGTSSDDVPFVTLLDITNWLNGSYNMVSLTGTSYLPEGCTFSEAGILYVKAETDSETLVLENEGKKVSDKEIKRTSVSENQMFKLSASYTETGLTARGYLVYLDSDGERQVIYTDINYISNAPVSATSAGIEENIDFENQ